MKVKKDILSKISSSLTSPTNSRRLKTANRSNIYLYQNTVTKNSELNIGEREESVVVPRDTAVATIDLEPLLNWAIRVSTYYSMQRLAKNMPALMPIFLLANFTQTRKLSKQFNKTLTLKKKRASKCLLKQATPVY